MSDVQDLVAMARTGSSKTAAAFLIPMFERLKARIAKSGARAIVLSPTRELALQTLRFCKELGRFSGLTYSCVLGGDAMEKQFAAIQTNPDVLFATPGRFVHVCMEMNLRLTSVEFVVFDEDDGHRKLGVVTLSVLDEFTDTLTEWHREKVDLIHTKEQAANAYKRYLKSRPGASKESLKRCKEIKEIKIGPHPVLKTDSSDLEEERVNFLEQIKI